MRILLFILLSICALLNAAHAQSPADTSFHILWYKGKKISPASLRTPAGDTVMYNAAKGVVKVVAASNRGKAFDNMLTECNKTNQRMNEMLKKISNGLPKPALPAYSRLLKNAFKEVQENYTGILSNTLILPDDKLAQTKAQPATGPAASEEDEDVFEQAVSELEAYMQERMAEKITTVPTPPRKNFSYCYSCHNEAQEAYKKDFERFINELAGADKAQLQKAISISRQACFFKSEAEQQLLQYRINKVIAFLMQRVHDRALLLLEKYIDDPDRCNAALQVALTTDRQEQLMAYTGTPLPQGYLARGLRALSGKLKTALDEKDYSIALNIQLIFSTERQFQLLGETMPDGLFQKALRFNQFKLSVNVSAKVSAEGGYQLAAAKGDNWFIAIPDSNCLLQWYLVGPYVNKMKVDLTASEMRGNSGAIDYVGTKNWMSDAPKMRFGFCGQTIDSIEFYSFHPEGFQELWRMPPPQGVMNLALTNSVLLNCFLDIERIKEDAAKFEDGAEVEKLKQEMTAKYRQMLKNNKMKTAKNNSAMSFKDLGQWADVQKMSREFSTIVQKANPGRYLFTPQIHNKTALIIDEKMNGKELFPQNTATEYAWFFMKLEHDPDGPYAVHF